MEDLGDLFTKTYKQFLTRETHTRGHQMRDSLLLCLRWTQLRESWSGIYGIFQETKEDGIIRWSLDPKKIPQWILGPWNICSARWRHNTAVTVVEMLSSSKTRCLRSQILEGLEHLPVLGEEEANEEKGERKRNRIPFPAEEAAVVRPPRMLHLDGKILRRGWRRLAIGDEERIEGEEWKKKERRGVRWGRTTVVVAAVIGRRRSSMAPSTSICSFCLLLSRRLSHRCRRDELQLLDRSLCPLAEEQGKSEPWINASTINMRHEMARDKDQVSSRVGDGGQAQPKTQGPNLEHGRSWAPG